MKRVVCIYRGFLKGQKQTKIISHFWHSLFVLFIKSVSVTLDEQKVQIDGQAALSEAVLFTTCH